VNGGCHCGNILVEIELPRPPDTYTPRACDCEFCSKHGASYVSDPKGSLVVRTRDASEIRMYRQGSGQAEFLLCSNCGVLVGVFYRTEGKLYGTVNAKVVGTEFGAARPASPKQLSDRDKVQRWQELWFPNVGFLNIDASDTIEEHSRSSCDR
jgi:hypothetical protein